MALTPSQIDRYARHLTLREIGGAGQNALLAARVAIIGAGGLGGPAGLYLAAAGVDFTALKGSGVRTLMWSVIRLAGLPLSALGLGLDRLTGDASFGRRDLHSLPDSNKWLYSCAATRRGCAFFGNSHRGANLALHRDNAVDLYVGALFLRAELSEVFTRYPKPERWFKTGLWLSPRLKLIDMRGI